MQRVGETGSCHDDQEGSKEKKVVLYYGRVDRLTWDPERFIWNWGGWHTVHGLHYEAGQIDVKTPPHSAFSGFQKIGRHIAPFL